jgi:RNA polymerase sigma-70 factor, ECF subfamily
MTVVEDRSYTSVERPDPHHGEFGDADDALIAAGLRSRDVAALAEAYRRHNSHVMAMVRRHSGGSVDAEDVSQDVFSRLWQRPGDFDPARGSLVTFLLTMARYRTIDRLRSDGARARREERQERTVRLVDDHVGQAIEAESIRREVEVSLEGLPSPERTAIRLAYFAGHTYRDVARVLGEPEGTVKSRIRSGLRRLRSEPALAELQLS